MAQGGAVWQDLASFWGYKAPDPGLTEPPSPSGLTALHVAVTTECHEAVLLLLERGADIDAVVSKGAQAGGGAKRGGVQRGGTGMRAPAWVGGAQCPWQDCDAGPRARGRNAGRQHFGQSLERLKDLPSRRRTLKAAAPHSSTPWKTTA